MINYLRRSIKKAEPHKKLIFFLKQLFLVVSKPFFTVFHLPPLENQKAYDQPDNPDYAFRMTIIPIIEQTKQLAKLFKKNKLHSMPIVSVAGCSGAGKTHFARLFNTILRDEGLNVFLLEQDNFLQYDGNFNDPMPHINPFLKWKQVHQVMEEIKKGSTEITMPFLNRATMPYSIEYRTVNLSEIDVILFEGTYSLGDDDSYNFFKHCNLGIFLDTSPANSAQWVKDREQNRLPHLQRSPEKLEKDIHAELQRYHNYVVPSKKNASFIIYKEKKNKYSVFVLHKNIKND